MNTLNEDLSAIKEVEDTIIANKVANFAYTDEAYTTNDANGVPEYNVNNEQNIPTADPSILKVNDTVLSKGYRAQASSVTRMMLNHFFGRMSYNLNKVNDNVSNLITTLITHRGTANGIATLDNQGRIPYSQLPESVGEVKKVNNILPTNGNVTLTANDVNAVPSSAKGQANGVASLDNQGRLPYSQLPESAVLAKFYRYLYTGRDLVEVFGVSTAVQAFAKLKEKSDTGDFSGLGIGDYINIPSIVIDGNTITYNSTYQNLRAEIVAFDQYYGGGDIDITDHHIIMQLKNCPFTRTINTTATNTDGWKASELKTYLSNTVAPAIEDAIGIRLTTISRYLSTHGGAAWLFEKCFLPSEVECIGTKAWSDNYGKTVGNSRQWAMFQLRPDRLIKFYNEASERWWTCSDSTSDATNFVHVSDKGSISHSGASLDCGVPLAFAI